MMMTNEMIQAIADKNTLIAVMVDDEHVILDLNGKREMVSCWDLLAAASDHDNKKEANAIMRFASRLFHGTDNKTFNALYGSVRCEITVWEDHARRCRNSERRNRNERSHKKGAAK